MSEISAVPEDVLVSYIPQQTPIIRGHTHLWNATCRAAFAGARKSCTDIVHMLAGWSTGRVASVAVTCSPRPDGIGSDCSQPEAS